MKRIKGIGRYNKTSSFRFDLICVHQVLSVFDNDFVLRVDHYFTDLLISVNSACPVIGLVPLELMHSVRPEVFLREGYIGTGVGL